MSTPSIEELNAILSKAGLTDKGRLLLVPAHMKWGGSDKIRRLIGACVFDDDTNPPSPLLGYTPNPEDSTDLRASVTKTKRAQCLSDKIEYIETNPQNINKIDPTVPAPNLKIPFRLYANPEKVYGDVHWREIFTGGEWADESYDNIIDTSTVYYDSLISLYVPIDYRTIRKAELDGGLGEDGSMGAYQECHLRSSYLDYNHYVQAYQDWALERTSELLIPNYNIVSSFYHSVKTGIFGSPDLEETIAEQIGYSKQKVNLYKYHFPLGTYYNHLSKDQYFGTYFPNTGDNLAYRDAALLHQQNIIFDQHYWDSVDPYDDGGISSIDEMLASESLNIRDKLSTFYNIKLTFDRHVDNNIGSHRLHPSKYATYQFNELSFQGATWYAGSARVMGLIEDNNFSSKFLELLKDIDEGTITSVPRKNLDFHYNYLKQTWGSDGYGQMIETNDPGQVTQLKSMNFLHFLLYAYNNYDVALNDNFIFMGPPQPSHVGTMATDSLYRNMNSQNMIGVIDGVYDLKNSYFKSFYDTFVFGEFSEDVLKYILGPTFKFKEVLAYKIEKYSTEPTGDSSTGDLIQKFWFLNGKNASKKISLTDSQVKYGKNYTYKISAYTLVMTHKYKYADFRLTKQIGTGKLLPDAPSEVQYCLNFYNPETNEISPQLLTPHVDPGVAAEARSAIAEFNQFATSEIDIAEYPQLADFHMYIEPCLELIEIPIYQKTIKTLDNPPNAINVVPFHFIDNSNRLGFKIGQDSFIQRKYPELITDADLNTKNEFLNTREYIEQNLIEKPSESPARYIEMYRIKKRPTSFSDFKDALVSTMDLRIANDVYNYSDHIASDKIAPNTKYYYLFRLLNENRLPGPVSQVIECELVNDGGYIYSLFDTIDSSEFIQDKLTTNSISFKKIMQIEPHIHQMYFDTSDVDYGDYAVNQISNLNVGIADEVIWDKRFKIRLTSKKTGKKLDLNMTFNLKEKNLSKLSTMTAPPDAPVTEMATHTDLEGGILSYDSTEGTDISPATASCEGCRDDSGSPVVDDPGTPPVSPGVPDDPPSEEEFENDDTPVDDTSGDEDTDDEPTNDETTTAEDDDSTTDTDNTEEEVYENDESTGDTTDVTDDTDDSGNEDYKEDTTGGDKEIQDGLDADNGESDAANTDVPYVDKAEDPVVNDTLVENPQVDVNGLTANTGTGMPMSHFQTFLTDILPSARGITSPANRLVDGSTTVPVSDEAYLTIAQTIMDKVWDNRKNPNYLTYMTKELAFAQMLLAVCGCAGMWATNPQRRAWQANGGDMDQGIIWLNFRAIFRTRIKTERKWTDIEQMGEGHDGDLGPAAPVDFSLSALFESFNQMSVPDLSFDEAMHARRAAEEAADADAAKAAKKETAPK